MAAPQTLTHEQATRYYDRFGAKQDSQDFYEKPVVDALVQAGKFVDAKAVFEFGSGTGRLALRLLERHLAPKSLYVGVDSSATMVRLASERVRSFEPRAMIKLTDGSVEFPVPDASFDRFVSTYVLDLLSFRDIDDLLIEAHRILKPGGRLCLAGLSSGNGFRTRAVAGIWTVVHRVLPERVGGCRPIDLVGFLDFRLWDLEWSEEFAPYSVPSECLVAIKR